MLIVRSLTLSVVLLLMLALAFVPTSAATIQAIDEVEMCSNGAAVHALGIEGGLLSLLTSRSNPQIDPVGEIVKNGTFTIYFVQNQGTLHLAYQSKNC